MHFAPNAPVTCAEALALIARAMIAQGPWAGRPDAERPYPGVPPVFGGDVATYAHYTQGKGGVLALAGGRHAGATRGWVAQALWAALDSP